MDGYRSSSSLPPGSIAGGRVGMPAAKKLFHYRPRWDGSCIAIPDVSAAGRQYNYRPNGLGGLARRGNNRDAGGAGMARVYSDACFGFAFCPK